MKDPRLESFLDRTYATFNRPEYIDPDPLLAVRDYADPRDREIAALVASSLAVGRAPLILRAARDALSRLGPSPGAFVREASGGSIRRALSGFRYRFFSGEDVASLLAGAAAVLGDAGSLGDFLMSSVGASDVDASGALSALAAEFERASPLMNPALFPSPERGSACKRPFLFLRWMVRSDSVDPGGWDARLLPLLVQPMDTHMTWVAARFGFIPCPSKARSPNLKDALEVTRRFAEYSPEDPVKFDFALTRPGIRPDLERDEWFSPCH